MKRLGLIVGIFLSVGLYVYLRPVKAATIYYISYSLGNNTNAGTSKGSPWKSAPGMQTAAGCAGATHAYTPTAGDQFTFHQGDTWPNACFDIVIAAGGSSGNPIVWTFDPTWGTAGGTTNLLGQPCGVYAFSAGGTVINGTDGFNRFIYNNNDSYMTFNGIEFTGMTWTGTGGSFGNVMGIDIQSSTNVIISKIYAHNWTHPGATSDALLWFVGHDGGTYNSGSELTGSVIDGAGASDSGSATFKIPIIDNNIIRNMSNGALPNNNASVHDNEIYNINASFDASDHENCIEPIGTISSPNVATNYIYNNLIHDCDAVNILTQGNGGSGAEIDYLWNNVDYIGSSAPIPFQFDTPFTNQAGSQIHAWNNTVVGGASGVCMRTINRGNGNLGVLELLNNHCISSVGDITLGVTGTSYTNTDLLMSVALANAQGYTAAEMYVYSPTSAANGTVGVAGNLSSKATGTFTTLQQDTTYGGVRPTNTRPSVGAWDYGAYQFKSNAATPAPPTNLKVLFF